MKPQETPKCKTGVPGLDEILAGGLPQNHLYLVQGKPGTGKTTLSLQFLMEGARRGESVLYVTFSETKAELDSVAGFARLGFGRRQHSRTLGSLKRNSFGEPNFVSPVRSCAVEHDFTFAQKN